MPITVVPDPTAERTSSLPPTAPMRSRMLRSPSPGAISPACEALAVIAHLEAQVAVAAERDRDTGRVRRVLRGVLHRLDAAEVGRGLNVFRVAVGAVDGDGHRHGRLQSRRPEGLVEPPAGEEGRVHAGGQRPELLERGIHVIAEAVQHQARLVRVLEHLLLGELQPDPKRHEALLAAVVQVPLDSPALLVGGGENAGARLTQILERLLDARGQLTVLLPDERVSPATASTNGSCSLSARSWITAPTGWCRSRITVTRRLGEGRGRLVGAPSTSLQPASPSRRVQVARSRDGSPTVLAITSLSRGPELSPESIWARASRRSAMYRRQRMQPDEEAEADQWEAERDRPG